jgi:polysaccharide pyruvyl transferase WcaK-like protein
MLFAAGIGPITNSFNKHLSKIVVNKVDCITLRENLSFHELEALGVTKPRIEVTADPVLTIPVDSIIPPDSVFDFEGIPTGMRYAAISLREWSVSPAYERTLAEACDYLFEGYGMTPIFICMQYPDDIKVSERIAAKMRNKSYILRGKYSVSSMLSLISRTELMIGMRLHSLIYAASLAKPLIALPY